jgi:hypothetical protein
MFQGEPSMTAEAAAKWIAKLGVGEEDCNWFRFFVNIFQLY